MKSVLSSTPAPPPQYPVLKRYTDDEGSFVVLFDEPRTGTVIQTGHPRRPIGDRSITFIEGAFTPLGPHETITLSN